MERQPRRIQELVGVVLEDVISSLGSDHPLGTYLVRGVAYHHAGLPSVVLEGIEELARSRALRFVCATTTVAEGADLPFRAVVLPHLNFQRAPLDRGLYGNIVGRAGRANVSMEGMVFVLDSNARTLQNYTLSTLWSDRPNPVVSRLDTVTSELVDLDERAHFGEMQSQVMAWLGEPGAYVDDQAVSLAQRTFAWQQGSGSTKQNVLNVLSEALRHLDELGMIRAGSPYMLTESGSRARLTGLSASSVSQFEPWVRLAENTWLPDLSGQDRLDSASANQVAELMFRSEEVAMHSLWIRGVSDGEKATQMGSLSAAHAAGLLDVDVKIVARWLMGYSYSDIANEVDERGTAASLFGRGSGAKRAGDACEYLSQITYACGWVWSSIRYLAPAVGPSVPQFFRNCIEFGVPTQTGAVISDEARVGRATAITLGQAFSTWSDARAWLLTNELSDVPVTSGDRTRLTNWKRAQSAGG